MLAIHQLKQKYSKSLLDIQVETSLHRKSLKLLLENFLKSKTTKVIQNYVNTYQKLKIAKYLTSAKFGRDYTTGSAQIHT